MKLTNIVVLATMLAITGCATRTHITEDEAGPYPDYKKITAEYIKKHFKDPYSLRDTMISAAAPYKIMDNRGYLVCFQANGKNGFGGYTGIQYTEIMITRDRVWDTGVSACNQRIRLAPWPEMDSQKTVQKK